VRRVILQKGDNLRTPSNKIMYKTTDSQHLKLKMGRYFSASLKLLACPTTNSNLLQICICQWDSRGFYDTIVPLAIPVLVAASRRPSSSVSSAIQFLFKTADLTSFIVENERTLTHHVA